LRGLKNTVKKLKITYHGRYKKTTIGINLQSRQKIWKKTSGTRQIVCSLILWQLK
jgi:hypothetical protein